MSSNRMSKAKRLVFGTPNEMEIENSPHPLAFWIRCFVGAHRIVTSLNDWLDRPAEVHQSFHLDFVDLFDHRPDLDSGQVSRSSTDDFKDNHPFSFDHLEFFPNLFVHG